LGEVGAITYDLHEPRPWNAFWGSIRRSFRSIRRDSAILMTLKSLATNIVPLRSGLLMDTLLQNMFISRGVGITTGPQSIKTGVGIGKGFHLGIFYNYPFNRPLIFKGNVKHSPPAKGYGYPYTVKDTIHVHPQIIRPSKTGKTNLYVLNDPTAVKNPSAALNREIQTLLLIELDNIITPYKKIKFSYDAQW